MPNFVRCKSMVTAALHVAAACVPGISMVLAPSLALGISACSSVTAPGNQLSAARQLWEERGPASYTYTLTRDCFCPPEWRGPVVITVRANAVVSRVYVNGGASVAVDKEHLFPTIEGLFGIVDDAIRRDAEPLEVDYHATLGYPKVIAIEMDQRPLDGGLTLTVSGFRSD